MKYFNTDNNEEMAVMWIICYGHQRKEISTQLEITRLQTQRLSCALQKKPKKNNVSVHLRTYTSTEFDFICFYFQGRVLQASCLVKMAGASLQGRAVISQTIVAMEPMKRIVGLPATLRMDTAAGRAPSLIILIGCWVLDLCKEYGLHMITHWWMRMVCDCILLVHENNPNSVQI